MINILALVWTTVRSVIHFSLLTVIAAIIIPLYSAVEFVKSVIKIVFHGGSTMQVGQHDCIVVIGAASAEGYTLVQHTACTKQCQVIACDGDSQKLHALYDSLPNVRVQLMDPTMVHDTKRLKEHVQATGRPLAAVFLVLQSCPPQGEVTLSTSTVRTNFTAGGGSTSSEQIKEYSFKQSSPFSLLNSSAATSNRTHLGSVEECLHYGKDSNSSTATSSSSGGGGSLSAFAQCCSEAQLGSTLRPMLEVPLKVAKEVGPALVYSSNTLGRNWQKGKARFVVVRPSVLDTQLSTTEAAASEGEEEQQQHELLRKFAQKVVMSDRLVSGALDGQLSELKEVFSGEVDVVNIRTLHHRNKLRDQDKKDFSVAAANGGDNDGAANGGNNASSASPIRARSTTNDTMQQMQGSIGAQSATQLLEAALATSPSSDYYLPSIHDGQAAAVAVGVRGFKATLKQQLRAVGTEEMVAMGNWLL